MFKLLIAAAIAGAIASLAFGITEADARTSIVIGVPLTPPMYVPPPPIYYAPPPPYLPSPYGPVYATPRPRVCWSPGWWQDRAGRWHWRDHEECL